MRTPVRARLTLAVALAASLGAIAGCKKPEPKTSKAGDLMKSFVVKNVDSGQQYCQVCAYAGKPIVMAVAELGDARFEEGLVGIQKLLDAHQAKGLRAFAVLGRMVDGELRPPEDEAKAVAELRALKARLGLAFPLTVLPTKLSRAEEESYVRFHDAYELRGTPTVYLANVEDQVVWAGVLAPGQTAPELAKLAEAIERSL